MKDKEMEAAAESVVGYAYDMEPCTTLYIQFAERDLTDGTHIRKWSKEPFDGGERYTRPESSHIDQGELVEARNLAYGLLWAMQPIDRRRHKDDLACRAREALLGTMTKQDQADGITAARAALTQEKTDV